MEVNTIKLLEQLKEVVKILAEIMHLSESRTGNILQRPNLRNYEIFYLGKSSLQPNSQILSEYILVSIRSDDV